MADCFWSGDDPPTAVYAAIGAGVVGVTGAGPAMSLGSARQRSRALHCNRGRSIPEGARIHRSVITRMEDRESSYAPRFPRNCTIVD